MIEFDWNAFTSSPGGTPVLAFVTTIHCALLVLRKHRNAGNGFLVLGPSFLFTVFPWFLPSPAWLLTGLAVHLAWFVACEKLITPPPPARRPSVPAVQRPGAQAPAGPAARPAESPKAPKPRGFAEVEVLAAFDETPEIRTFRLTRPEGFAFQPGQFLIVRVEAGGKTQSRCYSICSAPSAPGYLEISVRRQGTVSRHLHESLAPGSKLRITGPGGAFVYPPGDRPIVLLAGGIGITPLLSMLRHALAAAPTRPVTLVLSAKKESFVPFADELRALARRHPRFRLAVTLTADCERPGCSAGRIDRRLLESAVANPGGAVWMICGPLPMIDEMRSLLGSMGIDPAQVHFEKFETATAAAAAAGTVRFRTSGKTLPAAVGRTILDLAEGEGIAIPTMCRAGVCGTCRTRLVAGEATGDFEALDHADRSAGWILACVATPAGNCEVEA